MTTEHQALEKAAPKTPAIITTPDEYRGAMLRWQEQRFNVLTPFANISGLAPSHGLISSVVQINTDTASQEVYSGLPFLKGGQVAIAKRGLRKIAEGLGISTRLEYVSVGAVQHYWHVKAIASYRGVDGAVIEREASQEWDLRNGSDRMKGWTANQVGEARKHGLRQCESRAINAAIRECGCGLKQAYEPQELQRAFVAIRVMFTPNMDNPEERRIVLERALGSTNAMYPQARGAELPPADPFHEDDAPHAEPRHVGSGSTVKPAEAEAPAKADEPPTADAVKIATAEFKDGETKGRKWRKYVIVDSRGVEYSTFDKQHFEDATRFKAENAWVEIATEGGQYNNIIEIVKAGTEPTLPGIENL